MSKQETSIQPYDEFSAKQKAEAVTKDLAALSKDETVIRSNLPAMRKLIVESVNAAIRQGEALRRICGHEQVSFDFVKEMQSRLPWGKDTKAAFETATARVAIARRFNGKALKWSDIESDARKFVLQQLQLLEVNPRGPADLAIEPIEPFARFMAHIARTKEELLRCLSEKPLEQRSPRQLECFLSDTQWVAEARERAEKLLKAQ